jgi:hypothetical protein
VVAVVALIAEAADSGAEVELWVRMCKDFLELLSQLLRRGEVDRITETPAPQAQQILAQRFSAGLS